jgi:hypothetical protein
MAATTQYDCGDPSADEQLVLEYINRARANPTAEGQRLGIDITEGLTNPGLVKAQPPLAMNKALWQIARAHSEDMYTRNFFDHTNPDGLDPFERMAAVGYSFTLAGENIATGSNSTATDLENLLMVDAGISGRGHRVNLLDIRSGTIFREIGVGYHAASTPNASGRRTYMTQDFGANSSGPFLVGVVYNDANGNGFYDAGEGLAGVTISPDSGTHFAVSSTSGGYAFPVGTSGSITVTASGGALSAAIVKTVSLSGVNVKQDFLASEAGGGGGGGGNGSFVSNTSTDTDGDGFPDEIESAVGTSPTDPSVTPVGGSAAGTVLPLAVTKLAIKLKFAPTTMPNDSIKVSGTIHIPDGFTVAGQYVVLDVGGVVREFTLDAKGVPTPKGVDAFKLRVKSAKGVVLAQDAAFSATFKKAAFVAALADEGLVGTADATEVPRTVPVVMLFSQTLYKVEQAQLYWAKANKTGKTK